MNDLTPDPASTPILLRVDASIRVIGSASRELADVVERQWREDRPHGAVVRRDVGTAPLPSDALGSLVEGKALPAADRSPQQQAAVALGAELVEELASADAVLVAVPLHNFGVSQHVKIWIDLVLASLQLGSAPLLEGKAAVLVAVRGGAYGEGTPREGWDHSTPYLRRILAEVWGAEVTMVEREFTLVGVNPALEEFTEAAGLMYGVALSAAMEAGSVLARF
ncbi:MAG TPA: NAD(P)H-dependent oxidoreductase [Marmoricola sp.]|jgi:FMN-dependent NADH-azoreductase|nr:NAD(P)H-dependent oxidoreductase [Marmoricola sp.]